MFTELESNTIKQKNKWEKNRKYIYSVSIANFIKSLYNNSLLDNGYSFVWEHKKEYNVRKTYNDPRLGINSITVSFPDNNLPS